MMSFKSSLDQISIFALLPTLACADERFAVKGKAIDAKQRLKVTLALNKLYRSEMRMITASFARQINSVWKTS